MTAFDLSIAPVTKIISAMRFAPTFDTLRRDRPSFGIFLKAHGTTYARNATQTVPFTPDCVVLLPKGSNYTITTGIPRDPGETYVIEFDCADGFGWDKDHISSWKLNDPTLLSSLFSEAARVWTFKKTAFYPRCMSILYRIFAELERERIYVASPGRGRLKAALALFEERFSDPTLSVDDLAEAAGMSRSYFTKLFGQFYCLPPAEYVRMIRIDKAKALLSEGSLSVSEVAESVGFSSLYYFSAAFKRVVGVCPVEVMGQFGRSERKAPDSANMKQ